MADLNLWTLAYADQSLDFGLLANDYPFSGQVDIGDPDLNEEDSQHPTSDGTIMGRDVLGGFDLTFQLTTVPDFPLPSSPWRTALDLYSAFRSKWRADKIRLTPGAYASLLNHDRNRLVYGRPRKCSPNTDRLRKGLLTYTALFSTNDPNWYSGTEKAAIITPVPSSSGKIVTPLTSPISTIPSGDEVSDDIENEGDVDAWPVIDFHGPGKAYSLELLDGATVLWKIQIPDAIGYDQVLTVDTTPWHRCATIGGAPANGRLRGDQLEKCVIPPGRTLHYRFKVSDATGTAFADIKWRDAFASM